MSHYFENDDNLKSEIKEYQVNINETNFIFNTDNGVFSKNKLDYGTNLLIKNILKIKPNGDVLDLGCGYGPIGIIIKKICNVNMTMVDINRRGIHLVKMNAKKNNVLVNAFVSDGFSEIKDNYDYILSNPPIRIGKTNLYRLINDGMKHLKNDGMMMLVVRKEQGALSLMKDMSINYNVSCLDKDKGFLIISLKND